MGFILPFVLTFVAIPLESFIHSFRTVSGLFGVWLLHMLVVSIRFTANVIFGLGRMLISVYDLVIFIPLKIESLFRSNKDKDEEEKISGILTHQNEKAEE